MSTSETREDETVERQPGLLMEVSNTMVRLHKEYFGRGPTAARSIWAGPDALICILEETLTPAERNLVRMGEDQRLRDVRMFFQHATEREFIEPVEQITGRKVRAFTSSMDTKADGLVAELFVFYPEGQDGPSRLEVANPK